MSTKTSYNNGNLLQGARKIALVTEGEAPRNYIATDVKETEPTNRKEFYDDQDQPMGAIQTNGFRGITATLIGKKNTAKPRRHDTFVYDSGDGEVPYVLGPVETGVTEQDVTKYSITAHEVIAEEV